MKRPVIFCSFVLCLLIAAILGATRNKLERFENPEAEEPIDPSIEERKMNECLEKKQEILKEIEEIKNDREKTMKRPTDIKKRYQSVVDKIKLFQDETKRMNSEIEVMKQTTIPKLNKEIERLKALNKKTKDYVNSVCL